MTAVIQLYADAMIRIDKLERENSKLRSALERLHNCDFVITPLDRMDAVRDIAREALKEEQP